MQGFHGIFLKIFVVSGLSLISHYNYFNYLELVSMFLRKLSVTLHPNETYS